MPPSSPPPYLAGFALLGLFILGILLENWLF